MSDVTHAHANLFGVSDQDFEAKVLKSELPVIVDFSADWCPPCRAIAPVYDRLSKAYEGKLVFTTIDVDENQITPTRFGVQGFPTFIIFNGGKEIGRIIGAQPTRFQRLIDGILAENGVV